MRRANLKTKIMNEAEKLLEKFARKNMIQWNQESFKRTHSRLHKSIIEAINEALRIHDVIKNEVAVCDYPWHDNEVLTIGGCTKCKEYKED
jgi:hypothetical protein